MIVLLKYNQFIKTKLCFKTQFERKAKKLQEKFIFLLSGKSWKIGKWEKKEVKETKWTDLRL